MRELATVPLDMIRRTALMALTEQGVNVTTDGPAAYSAEWEENSRTYRIKIKTSSYIQLHHLRNMECLMGVVFGSTSLECNELGWATVIVIST
jgi:hypothetical protein